MKNAQNEKAKLSLKGSVTYPGFIVVAFLSLVVAFVSWLVTFLIFQFLGLDGNQFYIIVPVFSSLFLYTSYLCSAISTEYFFYQDALEIKSLKFLFLGFKRKRFYYKDIANIRRHAKSELIFDLTNTERDIGIYSSQLDANYKTIEALVKAKKNVTVVNRKDITYAISFTDFLAKIPIIRAKELKLIGINPLKVLIPNGKVIGKLDQDPFTPERIDKKIQLFDENGVLMFSVRGTSGYISPETVFFGELLDKEDKIMAKLTGSCTFPSINTIEKATINCQEGEFQFVAGVNRQSFKEPFLTNSELFPNIEFVSSREIKLFKESYVTFSLILCMMTYLYQNYSD